MRGESFPVCSAMEALEQSAREEDVVDRALPNYALSHTRNLLHTGTDLKWLPMMILGCLETAQLANAGAPGWTYVNVPQLRRC